MIGFSIGGSTRRTQRFLETLQRLDVTSVLHAGGKRGVEALRNATPSETGVTAASWTYEIEVTGRSAAIHWVNRNNVNGVNVAIILQYGHGTGTGGWVAGQDYINPAIKPIFDEIAEEVWRRVKSA